MMSNNQKRFYKYWLPVILWMALIFVLSSLPGEEIPKIDLPNIDKIVHFSEFFILGLLLIRALLNSNLNLSLTKLVILSIVVASLYAVTDEWRQRFVPDRTPDILDFVSDFIGLSIGVLIYRKRGQICHR